MDRRTGRREQAVRALLLLLALSLETSGEAHALALRGPPAEMSFEDIPLGRASGAGRHSGVVRVANTGDEPIDLIMRLAAVGPENLKDGYEPARDLAWARLARTRLRIPPGTEGESALLFALPQDSGLSGGQFQLEWIGEAVASGGAKLVLRSRILLSAAADGARISQARRKVRGKAVPGFALSPPEGRAVDVALGRRLDLRELGVALKLVNPTQRQATFAVVSYKETLDSDKKSLDREPSEAGFSPAPNPNFLRPASPVVSLGPDSVGEARFFLEIPDQRRYRGRNWVFTVRVEPLGAEGAAARDFRLLVTTQGEAAM